MNLKNGILAMDVGSGTQDILVWRAGQRIENCPKLILPSPTQIISRQVKAVTQKGHHLFLWGHTMGGGASTKAVREHISAGLRVFAMEQPALTFHDRIDKIRSMGIEIVDKKPSIEPLDELEMGDLNLAHIEQTLQRFHEPMPETVAVAVQDHGYSPNMSNRVFRFEQWKKLLESGKSLTSLLYEKPPDHLTRMKAISDTAPGTLLMDTGASAITGALLDPWVAEKSREGVTILNIGNEHVLAALVKKDTVWGIYEHHTSRMTPQKLMVHLERFRLEDLSNREILDEMGHGCHIIPGARKISAFSPVGITGPNREKFSALGGHMAAPFGDMMLTGCFGLVKAVQAKMDP
ncbi:MAG: hypothetical protein B6240_10060 [Desulfobacteraceae bacterium 4572_87]|nr:MAG: hypothetical protein B6240_10060 [Desulfobacteraceae bacterium 4572_87]